VSTTHIVPQTATARTFVRNFNIMLKFSRMYGFGHARTAEQIEKTWTELLAVLSGESDGDVLLAASGSQLLLNGSPLGHSAADRNFAQLLTSIGLSSVHFSSNITREDFDRFVENFPSGGAAPPVLAEKYKRAMDGVSGIRLNEICFVPADPSSVSPELAAQITRGVLGSTGGDDSASWFNDPERLLQLIAAAEGSRGGGSSNAGEFGSDGNLTYSPGDPNGEAGGAEGGERVASGKRPRGRPTDFWTEVKAAMRGLQVGSGPLITPEQEDICKILRLLRQLKPNEAEGEESIEPEAFQNRLSTVSVGARVRFNDALQALAAQAPAQTHDKFFLVRLAEHMAIRFAVDTYERGDAQVTGVQQMLERMGKEISALRDILGAHESKMKEAGIAVEAHSDQLERQFWAAVPEETKRSVLLSSETWCLPPRHVAEYLGEQQKLGDHDTCREILSNYLKAVDGENPDAQRKTFSGLCDLAECYGAEDDLLGEAITRVGARIGAEQDREMRSLASAAFVRLGQEGATRRSYPALQLVLSSLEKLESQAPTLIQGLQQRIGLEDRLSEFFDDAVRDRKIPDGLVDILQRLPRSGAKQLAKRFGQARFREDCDLLLDLFHKLGPEGIAYLKESLNEAPPLEAVESVGLLSRLDPILLAEALPRRLRECPRSVHDQVVRRIAYGGAPERGQLLAALYASLDPLIHPLALDEMGMSGDGTIGAWLLHVVESEKGDNELVRLKAIEAIARLRVREAIPLLKRILEEKHVFRWLHPSEVRIVAAQALAKIDHSAWQALAPRADLSRQQLSFPALDLEANASGVRQRRYPRLKLSQTVTAVTTNLRENFTIKVQSLNLAGGAAPVERHCPAGTILGLKFTLGMRSARAQALVRESPTGTVTFEIVEITLADRSRLRQFLTEVGRVNPPGSAKNRVRRRPPTRSKR